MIDHDVWLGRWPFRDLGERGRVDELLRSMDRLGIAQAWVSPLDAVFHRTPHQANAGLLAALAPHADRLLPVPVLNPALEDTASHLAELRSQAPGLSAVRVLPAFSTATPDNAGAEGLPLGDLDVIWTLRLVDDRTRHPFLPLPVAALEQVMPWFASLKPRRLIVSGCSLGELAAYAGKWKSLGGIVLESSFMDGPEVIARARRLIGPDKLLPGSNHPLLAQDAMVALWREADLSPVGREQ